jgi:glutaredoxin
MRTCPKCSYVRKEADAKVPEWQCPSCGIAYAKFAEPAPAPSLTRSIVIERPSAPPISAKALFFILAGLAAAGWAGYERILKPKAAAEAAFEGEGAVLEVNKPGFYGTLENGQAVLRMKPDMLAGLQQIAPGKVVMFATNWCPYCSKAREVLAQKGVRYTEVNVEMDGRAAEYQKDTFGSNGVPLIVIGNRVMMGWDEGELLRGLREI